MSKRQKTDKQLFNSLAKDFHELVSNKHLLRPAIEHFLNNVIDEITLGIIFDQHRKYKTNAYDLEIDENCDGYGNLELVAQNKLKKTLNCICPACKREYAATRFANHLRSCMGMGRKSRSCNASKRVVNSSKDRENSSSYGAAVSDDDDDPDWGSGEQRKKKKDKNKNRNTRGNFFIHIKLASKSWLLYIVIMILFIA